MKRRKHFLLSIICSVLVTLTAFPAYAQATNTDESPTVTNETRGEESGVTNVSTNATAPATGVTHEGTPPRATNTPSMHDTAQTDEEFLAGEDVFFFSLGTWDDAPEDEGIEENEEEEDSYFGRDAEVVVMWGERDDSNTSTASTTMRAEDIRRKTIRRARRKSGSRVFYGEAFAFGGAMGGAGCALLFTLGKAHFTAHLLYAVPYLADATGALSGTPALDFGCGIAKFNFYPYENNIFSTYVGGIYNITYVVGGSVSQGIFHSYGVAVGFRMNFRAVKPYVEIANYIDTQGRYSFRPSVGIIF